MAKIVQQRHGLAYWRHLQQGVSTNIFWQWWTYKSGLANSVSLPNERNSWFTWNHALLTNLILHNTVHSIRWGDVIIFLLTTESNFLLKSDKVVSVAGDFGPKSSASIHYIMWISLILKPIDNIKNIKTSCNCEIINK